MTDITELSLEELLDMKIGVASRNDEKISDAPASITAWADEDMNAFGYHSLYDLANFTAGYGTTVMYGERVLETRGQKAGSFNNNKHLIYVDGIPVNHARNYKGPIDEELPLFFARRVELMRGPASALYGTGAFFGVINVVPHELSENGTQVDTRLTAGSLDAERRVAGNAFLTDDNRSFRISLGYYGKDASRDFVGVRDDPDNVYFDDQASVFLNAAYTLRSSPLEGLTLAFLYLRKNGGLGESWLEATTTHELNDLTWETIIPYVKYDRALGERVSVNGYLLWNTGREKGWWVPLSGAEPAPGTGTPFFGYDTQTDAIQGQAETHWQIASRTDLIVGVNSDTRQQAGEGHSYGYGINADPGEPYIADPTLFAPSDRYSTYSAYAQVRQELPLLKGLIATAGVRDDYGSSPSQDYNQVSPRFGLVQRLTEHLNLKAFYGTALRAPGIKEIGLNQEAKADLVDQGEPVAGIADLTSETIRSIEGGASYSDDHVAVSGTLFSNKTQDALDGVPHVTGVNIFQNSPGATDAFGGEAELQVAVIRDLRVFVNYAGARATDPSGVDLEDVPVNKANLGVIYRLPGIDLTTAAAVRYIDHYRVANGDDDVPGSTGVDLNVVWGFAEDFAVEVQARNVLDQRVKLPKHGREDVPLPGFRVLGTLSYGF